MGKKQRRKRDKSTQGRRIPTHIREPLKAPTSTQSFQTIERVDGSKPWPRVLKLDSLLQKSQSEAIEDNWRRLSSQRSVQDRLERYGISHYRTFMSTELEVPRSLYAPDVNVLQVGSDYVILYKDPHRSGGMFDAPVVSNTLHVKILRNVRDAFRPIKGWKLESARGTRFWQQATIAADRQPLNIQLFGYDPEVKTMISLDVMRARESEQDVPEMRSLAYWRHYEHDKENLARSLLPIENETIFINGPDYLAAFYDWTEGSIRVYDLQQKVLLWEKQDRAFRYSAFYRGMIVSAAEEEFMAHEQQTGQVIIDTTLDRLGSEDELNAYTPPVSVGGSLYVVAQEGQLLNIRLTNNEPVTNSNRGSSLREQIEDLIKRTKKSGFKVMETLDFAVPYLRCEPIVNGEHIFVYGNFYRLREWEKYKRNPAYIPNDSLELAITRFSRNHSADAIRWIISHLSFQDARVFAKLLPQVEINDAESAFDYVRFWNDLGTALFRSKGYYEESRLKSFIEAYDISQIDDQARDAIPIDVRFISVAEVFSLIYACLESSFAYEVSFPDFSSLLFSERKEVRDRVRIDFTRSALAIPRERVSQRALYLLEDITSRGGLYRGEGDPGLWSKLQRLEAVDRAFIYESDLFQSQKLTHRKARALGNALRSAGFPKRALCYTFLASLLPLDKHGLEEKDGIYDALINELFRACGQLIILGEEDNRSRVRDKLDESLRFQLADHSWQHSHWYFAQPASYSFDAVLNNLSRLRAYITQRYLLGVEQAYQSVNALVRWHLTVTENEKLQGEIVRRFVEVLPRLIQLELEEQRIARALEVFEDFKSLVLRMYLSAEKRVELRARILEEKYYLSLSGGNQSEGMQGDSALPDQRVRDARLSNAESMHERMAVANEGLESIEWGKIAPHLPKSTVILEYYLSDDVQGVFIATKAEEVTFHPLPDLHDCARIMERLGRMVHRQVTATNNERFIETLLGKLYDNLIRPIQHLVANYENLIIIPTSNLYDVPFTALHNGSRYLVESHNVVVNPSAYIFHLLSKKIYNVNDALVMLRAREQGLPGVEEEERTLLGHFGTQLTYIDNGQTFKRMKPEGYLHISAHGTFNHEEPLLSSIVLDGDDAITVLDLYSLDLDQVEVTVINTCVSGKARIDAGDELYGLVRGVFTAGCPSVVNTLWRLSDTVAPSFTDGFYSHLLQRISPASAFAETIRCLLRKPEFRNPYYWACYQYYGRL